MGKLRNSPVGPFTGTVGTLVGSTWKGIPYIKGPYKQRTKKISEDELANRKKFAMAQYWLRPLLYVVRVGFKGYSPTVEGFVAAKSWLLKNAMEGSGDDLRVNPALAKISHGDLPLPNNIAVTRISPDNLQFTWEATAFNKFAPDADQIMMLAYDIDHKDEYYNVAGQLRHTGADTLFAPAREGHVFHVYAAFIAADRSRQSNSVYLGEIS